MRFWRKRTAGGPRSYLWGAYFLLGVMLICPVIFVIWLVREAVANERVVVRQLLEEAAESRLEAAEEALFHALRSELQELETRVAEEGASIRSLLPELVRTGEILSICFWGTPERLEDRTYDSTAARRLLSQARLAIESGDQTAIAALLKERQVGNTHFDDGRSVAAMIGLLLLDGEKGPTDERMAFIRTVATDYQRFPMPPSQRRFLMKRILEASPDESVQQLLAAENVALEWRRGLDRDGRFPPRYYLSVGDDVMGLVDPADGFALLYSRYRFVERCARAIEDPKIALIAEKEGGASDYEGRRVERVRRPLSFLTLEYTGSDAEILGEDSINRDLLYVWIGLAVLVLSVISGAVILLFIRRQTSDAQLKNDLVATVTHELKTPVSSIRLLVDTLLDERRGKAVDQKEYLELIGRENHRLGHLIDNFLSFSRMERNKSGFEMARVAPGDVATDVENAFRERFKERKFTLECDVESDLPPVLCDKEAIGTALSNLLENAYKYGGREREIQLRVARSNGGVRFEVRDAGRGIARKEQKKIFRKFYQVDRDSAKHSGSVGLGLSIVSFIVSKHGGRIEVESELGKGSVFRMTIPYA